MPLPPKDPFGLVPSLMLIPLLIGGYMSATLVMAATGRAGGRWRAAGLAAFAILAGLVVDLVACFWLQGFASGKFWIVWPICSLIIAVVAFVAAVLQKLIGPLGTLLTIIVVILFGNPSSGGAERGAVPAHVLARHRALPAAAQRLHPAPPNDLLHRQRHHPVADRPARLPSRRRGAGPPAGPAPPRGRGRHRSRRGRGHDRPHRSHAMTAGGGSRLAFA